MASPNKQDHSIQVECHCLEQVQASLLEDERCYLETGLGDLQQVTCRSCGLTFLTNDRTAEQCPECQESTTRHRRRVGRQQEV